MRKFSRVQLARARKIKLLLMDVDGVLTDGSIYYVPRPRGGMVETKGFHSRDGLGIRLAHHAGLKTGIITGRSSPVIECRVRELGIHFLQQNALEKLEPYERIRHAAQVEDAEVCYVGDDIVDLPLFRRVGLAVCVGDGDEFLRRHVHLWTRRPGGKGAVREAIELILTAQGKWASILKSYQRGDRAVELKRTVDASQLYPLRSEIPRRTPRDGGQPSQPK
jgi:3-deoxy-D-manno-octulosonate 8-phosphate phosphatase (KDO 8-P phosphatase)